MEETQARKKMIIISLGLIIFLPLAIWLAWGYFSNEPSCYDGIQNQGELGIDCGGPCPQLCEFQVRDPIVHWSRAFEVDQEVYNLMAFIENRNLRAYTEEITYRFRVYDEDHIFIGDRVGETFINPNTDMVVFEPGFQTGIREPRYVFFDILDQGHWYEAQSDPRRLGVTTGNVDFQAEPNPTISATVTNPSAYSLPRFYASIIVYDEDDNAIHTSRTVVSGLESSGGQKDIFFSWPRQFEKDVERIRILLHLPYHQIDAFEL